MEKHDEPERLDDVEALKLLDNVMARMPKCPQCHTKKCVAWFVAFLSWTMKNVMSDDGFFRMFVALLDRAGGHLEFTAEELNRAKQAVKINQSVKPKFHLEPEGVLVELIYSADMVLRDKDDADWPSIIGS